MTESMNAAIAALLLIVLIGLACGGESAAPSEENGSGNPDRAASEEPRAEPDSPVQDGDPEELSEIEIEESPVPTRAPTERIRFRKGESQGRVTLDLAPNESRRYVVGVAPAQYFHIGMDDSRPVISLASTSGLSEIDKGDTFLDGVTTKSGDIVFEISNPTRSRIRTFALVTIKDREPMDH